MTATTAPPPYAQAPNLVAITVSIPQPANSTEGTQIVDLQLPEPVQFADVARELVERGLFTCLSHD